MKNILKFFWIKGRATRLEYWLTTFWCFVAYVILFTQAVNLDMFFIPTGAAFLIDPTYLFKTCYIIFVYGKIASKIIYIIGLLVLWIQVAASIRRLHDLSKDGKVILIYCLGVSGAIGVWSLLVDVFLENADIKVHITVFVILTLFLLFLLIKWIVLMCEKSSNYKNCYGEYQINSKKKIIICSVISWAIQAVLAIPPSLPLLGYFHSPILSFVNLIFCAVLQVLLIKQVLMNIKSNSKCENSDTATNKKDLVACIFIFVISIALFITGLIQIMASFYTSFGPILLIVSIALTLVELIVTKPNKINLDQTYTSENNSSNKTYDEKISIQKTEQKVVPSPKVVKEKKPVDKKKIILISSIVGGVLLVAGLTVLIVNLVKSNQQKKYEQMIIESERAIAEYEESLRLANPMLDHIQMIDVAGGTFMMGNNSSIADNDEKNIHTVTLSSFEMSQTEITQYAFETVMGYNPSQKKGSNTKKYAVENCTWFEALKFCNKLSEMYNYECVYSVDGKTNPDTWGQTPSNVMFDSSADGFRLPTEAEWEFAASERNYRPNYIHSGSDSSNVVGFFDKELHPVAQKKPNNLGLYDMSGNVLEWCWDWYGKNYPITEQYNPTGNTSGEDRILRGGSYKTPDGKCSITFRSHEEPQVPHDFVGFRVARKSDTPATYTSEPASRNPITSSSSSIDGNEIVSGILNLVTDGTSSELNKNVEDALENLATQAILDLIF